MKVDAKFLAMVEKKFCPQCGEAIVVDPSGHKPGRPRTFCSDACQKEFWRTHPRKKAWPCYTEQVCPICGKTFDARIERNRKRKYCSHSCANRARTRKDKS